MNESCPDTTRPAESRDDTNLPFEKALKRLEEIAVSLEGNAVSLDESLRLYEEGVSLIRLCTKELNTAEQRVKILQRTEDGSIRPVDFMTPDETEQA